MESVRLQRKGGNIYNWLEEISELVKMGLQDRRQTSCWYFIFKKSREWYKYRLKYGEMALKAEKITKKISEFLKTFLQDKEKMMNLEKLLISVLDERAIKIGQTPLLSEITKLIDEELGNDLEILLNNKNTPNLTKLPIYGFLDKIEALLPEFIGELEFNWLIFQNIRKYYKQR